MGREKNLPNLQQTSHRECSSSALTWELCILQHSSQNSKTCLQAFLLTLSCSGAWEQDTAPPTPQRGQQTRVSFSLSFMTQSHLAHSWGRCLPPGWPGHLMRDRWQPTGCDGCLKANLAAIQSYLPPLHLHDTAQGAATASRASPCSWALNPHHGETHPTPLDPQRTHMLLLALLNTASC